MTAHLNTLDIPHHHLRVYDLTHVHGHLAAEETARSLLGVFDTFQTIV